MTWPGVDACAGELALDAVRRAPPAVDLRGCGIGNVLLAGAGLWAACQRLGVRPRVVHDAPRELGVLDLTEFDVVAPPAAGPPPANAMFCTLGCLMDPDVAASMRRLCRVAEAPRAPQYHAGFCFRETDPALDGEERFMSEEAIETMMGEMARAAAAGDRVFACSNSAALLERALRAAPGAFVVSGSGAPGQGRNAPGHLAQWAELTKCAVVFHGVGDPGGPDGSGGGRTSTFAPTAAVVGGRRVVGVDNAGVVRATHGTGPRDYAWA